MLVDVLIFIGGAIIGGIIGGYLSYNLFRNMLRKKEFWMAVFTQSIFNKDIQKGLGKINEKTID